VHLDGVWGKRCCNANKDLLCTQELNIDLYLVSLRLGRTTSLAANTVFIAPASEPDVSMASASCGSEATTIVARFTLHQAPSDGNVYYSTHTHKTALLGRPLNKLVILSHLEGQNPFRFLT
jgi:hypothetical protein